MRERLTSRGRSHPGLLPLANFRFDVSPLLRAVHSEPDVSATVSARKRKLLTEPRHQCRPNDTGRVLRAGLCRRVATAPRDMSVDRPQGGRPRCRSTRKTPRRRHDSARRSSSRRRFVPGSGGFVPAHARFVPTHARFVPFPIFVVADGSCGTTTPALL